MVTSGDLLPQDRLEQPPKTKLVKVIEFLKKPITLSVIVILILIGYIFIPKANQYFNQRAYGVVIEKLSTATDVNCPILNITDGIKVVQIVDVSCVQKLGAKQQAQIQSTPVVETPKIEIPEVLDEVPVE